MRIRRGVSLAVTMAVSLAQTACETTEQNVALGVAAVTAYLGQAPTTEVAQTYYLGVFDPQDQVPPAVYRVRVRGQASALSTTNFASGWVRAELVDSLGTTLSAPPKAGEAAAIKRNDELLAKIQTARRLMMFGPEGFREAPANHRLVIVAGSSPEKFFEAVDSVLGSVAGAIQGQRNAGLNRDLLDALTALAGERTQLEALHKDLELDVALRERATPAPTAPNPSGSGPTTSAPPVSPGLPGESP